MDPASPRYAPSFVSQSFAALIDLASWPRLRPERGQLRRLLRGAPASGRPTTRRCTTTLTALINPGGGGTRQHSFDISVDGSAWVTVNLSTLAPVPGTAAASPPSSRTRINDALGALVPARQVATCTIDAGGGRRPPVLLRITADHAGGDNAAVRVRRAAANDLAAALMLGAENGGVELARRSDFRPAPTGTALRIEDGAGGLSPLNDLARSRRRRR